MKQFNYIIVADDFEKNGIIHKSDLSEVYTEIALLMEGMKTKNLKIEIKEKEDERND